MCVSQTASMIGLVRKDRVGANGGRPRQPKAEQASGHQTRAIGHANHNSSGPGELQLQFHFRE